MKINNDCQNFDLLKVGQSNVGSQEKTTRADNLNEDIEVLFDEQVEKYIVGQKDNEMDFEKINKAKKLVESCEIDKYDFSLLAADNMLKFGV